MKTDLDFEHDTTKKLLSKLDFEFFLKENIEKENYRQEDIDKIHLNYNKTLTHIKLKSKINKRQFNLYAEGQIRKMFAGGFLPSLFELNEISDYKLFDFESTGKIWAYFNYWQTYQKMKITRNKIWDIVVKIGSVLAIILSVIKLAEYFK